MQQAGGHVPTPYPHPGFQSVFRDHPRPRISNSTGAPPATHRFLVSSSVKRSVNLCLPLLYSEHESRPAVSDTCSQLQEACHAEVSVE